MLTIEKVEISSDLIRLIISLPFNAIILMSSTKILTTSLSRPGFMTKRLCSALICLNLSLLRKKLDSLLHWRRDNYLKLYKAFKSLYTMLRFVANFVVLGFLYILVDHHQENIFAANLGDRLVF